MTRHSLKITPTGCQWAARSNTFCLCFLCAQILQVVELSGMAALSGPFSAHEKLTMFKLTAQLKIGRPFVAFVAFCYVVATCEFDPLEQSDLFPFSRQSPFVFGQRLLCSVRCAHVTRPCTFEPLRNHRILWWSSGKNRKLVSTRNYSSNDFRGKFTLKYLRSYLRSHQLSCCWIGWIHYKYLSTYVSTYSIIRTLL